MVMFCGSLHNRKKNSDNDVPNPAETAACVTVLRLRMIDIHAFDDVETCFDVLRLKHKQTILHRPGNITSSIARLAPLDELEAASTPTR
jgi:hypothetical protein